MLSVVYDHRWPGPLLLLPYNGVGKGSFGWKGGRMAMRTTDPQYPCILVTPSPSGFWVG